MQKVLAKIHSKNGIEEEVTIYDQKTVNGCTTYFVETKDGIKCMAIYNPFCGCYYADDLYGVI
jgi:hypothetical protein